jgi:hypothetical protein
VRTTVTLDPDVESLVTTAPREKGARRRGTCSKTRPGQLADGHRRRKRPALCRQQSVQHHCYDVGLKRGRAAADKGLPGAAAVDDSQR